MFTSVGTVPAARGQQARSFYFNNGRAWRFLHLSPTQGDKRFAIGEVSPLVARGRLLDFSCDAANSAGMHAPAQAAFPGTPIERCHVYLKLSPGRDQKPGIITRALPNTADSTLCICLNGGSFDIELTGQPMTHGSGCPDASRRQRTTP